ncbi:Uncharacterised protein [Mycobacterium tuberculosis]|nr:Uncharacterised protein [Mycobacterium tuberculosis]
MDIYREIDQRVQNYQEQTQIKPPCFKGCSECCYHHFSVSQIEFELLMHEIRSKWSQEEIDELFDRAFECLETLKEEDPEPKKEKGLREIKNPEDPATYRQKMALIKILGVDSLTKEQASQLIQKGRDGVNIFPDLERLTQNETARRVPPTSRKEKRATKSIPHLQLLDGSSNSIVH